MASSAASRNRFEDPANLYSSTFGRSLEKFNPLSQDATNAFKEAATSKQQPLSSGIAMSPLAAAKVSSGLTQATTDAAVAMFNLQGNLAQTDAMKRASRGSDFLLDLAGTVGGAFLGPVAGVAGKALAKGLSGGSSFPMGNFVSAFS